MRCWYNDRLLVGILTIKSAVIYNIMIVIIEIGYCMIADITWPKVTLKIYVTIFASVIHFRTWNWISIITHIGPYLHMICKYLNRSFPNWHLLKLAILRISQTFWRLSSCLLFFFFVVLYLLVSMTLSFVFRLLFFILIVKLTAEWATS